MTPKESSQKKTAAIRARLKFADEQSFIEKYALNVDNGGIFIKTPTPRSVGTRIKFEFQIADGSPVLRGLGDVVWARDETEGKLLAGMGIKFLKLDARSQKVVDRIGQYKSENPSIARLPSRYAEGLESEPVDETDEAETSGVAEPKPQKRGPHLGKTEGQPSGVGKAESTEIADTESREQSLLDRTPSPKTASEKGPLTGAGRRRRRPQKSAAAKSLNLDDIDSMLAEIGGDSGAERKRTIKRRGRGGRTSERPRSLLSSEAPPSEDVNALMGREKASILPETAAETAESEAPEAPEAETVESEAPEAPEAETAESEAPEAPEAETVESEAPEAPEADTVESEAPDDVADGPFLPDADSAVSNALESLTRTEEEKTGETEPELLASEAVLKAVAEKEAEEEELIGESESAAEELDDEQIFEAAIESVLDEIKAPAEESLGDEIDHELEAENLGYSVESEFLGDEYGDLDDFPTLEAEPLEQEERLSLDDVEELDLEALEEIEAIPISDSDEIETLDEAVIAAAELTETAETEEINDELEIIPMDEELTGNVARLSRLLAAEMGETNLDDILDSGIHEAKFDSLSDSIPPPPKNLSLGSRQGGERKDLISGQPEPLLENDILDDALDDIFETVEGSSDEDAGEPNFRYNNPELPETLPDDAIPEGLMSPTRPKRAESPNALYESVSPPPADAEVPVPEAEPTLEHKVEKKKGFFKKLFG